MSKMAALLAGAALMLTTGVASAFPTITYDHALGDGGYTTTISSAVVETFDPNASFTQSWNWNGQYALVSGNLENRYSAPSYTDPLLGEIKESTNYISVPNPSNIGSVNVTNLGGAYNYFGLWWGSMDSYNTLQFKLGDAVVATISGSDLSNPANGRQWAKDTNQYVNFYFGSDSFDSFSLTSTNYAFEVDNIAIANVVPEPGTILLLGVGLLGLGFYGRRRVQK